MQQPSPFVADQPAAAGAPSMQEGAAAEAGTPPALAPSRSVQNSDAVLMDRCKQAVEQCRSDLADLRTAVKAANSHREKCAELLGAATEAVVALEDMLYDSNIDLPRERALQTLARRVQTAMDQGEAVVKVYGHMSGIAKLASKVCSPGTPLKFDESTRELTSLAKQARLAQQQPPAARMLSSPSNLAAVGSLVVPLGSQPPLTGSAARTASTALAEDAPGSDAGTQASTLLPSASGLTASGLVGGAAAAAAGAAQAVAGAAQPGAAAVQGAADGEQGLAAQGSSEQQSSAGAAAAAAQVAAPSSSSQLVVGSRLVPEEAMQAARIRKGSRGQAITALVHVPPGDDQPPGHLGFLWYYLSRGLFKGSLYRRDLSKQEDWELRDARHGPDVNCMCYDDVNHCVWTGHRNGGIRVWSAAKDESVLDLYRAFQSAVSAITTDERGCCWAASDKGKVRCFQLEAVGADGIHEGYRVAKLGELNTVSEGVPFDYGSADVVNGMVTHPLAREPAHYGPVRSMAAAMGRVWTCGGSSAFASFKEWTQQGVLLGSQSMRLTGLANDIVLVSQVVGVQENQRVSVNASGMNIGSFSVGGVASLATGSRLTVNQVVDVEMPWQLLTVHDSGAIQVWGVVDKALVPLVRIGDRVAPALRLIVCEPLGLLITAHNDGKLRLRALPHPRGPECINVVFQGAPQDDQLHKVTDATLPCAQIDTSKTGLAQAVGNRLVGVITASNYATIKHFPTAELRRTVEEHNAEHPERYIKILGAINVDESQYPFWQLSPAGLTVFLEDIKRHQAELLTLNSLEYQSSLGVGSRFEHDSEGGGAAERSVFAGETNKWQIEWPELRTIRIIGEGAFGKVWLGRWQETDVAIKQLGSLSALGVDTGSLQHDSSGGIKLDKEVQRALDKEVNLLKEMRHPNIILFMGVVLEPAAVVTEYCARGSLYDLLKAARQNAGLAKALDWPKRISMALDAAKGMLYLHGHKPPIIHRDLKSPNLLVEKNWRVKVTDFNLSRVSRTDNVASVQSMVANNPRWQPPEVILRQQYGKESDVYAFGLILWELLTWELPFMEMSTLQIMLAVTQQAKRPPVPSQYEAAQLPGGTFSAYDAWVALMQRCWAEKPEHRPNFEQIINDLRKIGAAVAEAKQRPPGGAMLRSAGSRNFARAVATVMASNSSRGLQASSSSGALVAAATAAAANPAAANAAAQQQQAAVVANGAAQPQPQLPAPAAPSPFDAPVAAAAAAGAAAAGAAAAPRLIDSAYAAPPQGYGQPPAGSEGTTPDGPLSTRTSGSALPTTASGSVVLAGTASGASVLSGTPPPPSPFNAPSVISSAAPPPPGPFSSAPAAGAAAGVIVSNAAVPAGPFGGGPAPWLQQAAAPPAGQAVASNAQPPPSPFGGAAAPAAAAGAAAGGAVISSNAPPPPSPFGGGPAVASAPAAASGPVISSNAPPPPSPFGDGPAAAAGQAVLSSAPPPPSPFGGAAVASAPAAASGPVISSNAPPPPSPFGDGPAAAGQAVLSSAPPPPSPFGGFALPAGVAVSSAAPPPPSPFGGLAAVAAPAPAGPSPAAEPAAPPSPMSRMAARQPPDGPPAHARLGTLPSTVLEATPSVEAAAARADEWPGSATSPSATVGGPAHPLATIPSGGTDDAMSSAPSGGRRGLVDRLRKSLSGNARQRGAQA